MYFVNNIYEIKYTETKNMAAGNTKVATDANKQMIIDALRAEIEDTKYKDLSDEELYEITRILAEHLEYAEYNSFDDIFQALEDAGYQNAEQVGSAIDAKTAQYKMFSADELIDLINKIYN